MEKKICVNCGHELQVVVKDNVISDKYLCLDCRLKLFSLPRWNPKLNTEKMKELEKRINNEMRLANFNESAIKAVNEHFCEKVKKGEEEKIIIQQKKDEIEKAKQEFQKKCKNHMLTTGFEFKGYNIVSYLDVVSGECVIGTGIFSSTNADLADVFGGESSSYRIKLREARDIAKQRAIFDSIKLGGNAIIGMDIDYVTFSSDKIGVVVSGTSVLIEKE